MSTSEPLWRVMQDAYNESMPPSGKKWQSSYGYAAEIRALVDARLPEEEDVFFDKSSINWWRWNTRQSLRRQLLADADEAEAGG